VEKLEWWIYNNGEKKFENMLTYFDRIHERDRQADRHTPHDRIGRAYA